MSRFVQVGMSAMRDPVTKELLPSVPLYVEVPDGAEPVLPEIDTDTFAMEVRKVMREETAEKKKPADAGTPAD